MAQAILGYIKLVQVFARDGFYFLAARKAAIGVLFAKQQGINFLIGHEVGFKQMHHEALYSVVFVYVHFVLGENRIGEHIKNYWQ
jgi:hypothetical protein